MKQLVRTGALAALFVMGSTSLARGGAPFESTVMRLRADVIKMVGFGTRHTASLNDHKTRGIGAARRWATDVFVTTGRACGNCLKIVHPERVVQAARLPSPTKIVNVVAIQPGTERPNEVVIVQAHIDSRASDVMNATIDAPGANDNASGTALVLETARQLSREKFPTTIVYAILSGEEQGLHGGQLMADYAREQGWTVKAVLNNDIVGGSRGADGVVDDRTVRVFSEGPRADASDATRAAARRFGGENDSPSRNLSRYIAEQAVRYGDGLRVRQIWRADRMGRGGDHLPFLDAGIPAIRFSVGIEDYDHQHQDVRVEGGTKYGDTVDEMDFDYLAKVTQLNVMVLSALAAAPMPPAMTLSGAVQVDSVLGWTAVAGAQSYRIWYRRTDAPDWVPLVKVNAPETTLRLPGVRGDDWLFGISAVSITGAESPISSAVPGGAFVPLK